MGQLPVLDNAVETVDKFVVDVRVALGAKAGEGLVVAAERMARERDAAREALKSYQEDHNRCLQKELGHSDSESSREAARRIRYENDQAREELAYIAHQVNHVPGAISIGEAVRRVVVARDQAERLLLVREDELKNARDELKAAVKDRDAFYANQPSRVDIHADEQIDRNGYKFAQTKRWGTLVDFLVLVADVQRHMPVLRRPIIRRPSPKKRKPHPRVRR